VPAEQLLDAAVAYAADLAENCSPQSIAIIKRQLRAHADVDFATALAQSDELMLASFELPDVKEGVSSYLEKRAPDFAALPPRRERLSSSALDALAQSGSSSPQSA
jgi:enoyl-CoA hydratase/carnithine racemase